MVRCRHDMEQNTCGYCQHISDAGVEPDLPGLHDEQHSSRAFPAQYSQVCSHCGEWIEMGDFILLIQMTRQYRHEDCP